jgi:hypothetical protein
LHLDNVGLEKCVPPQHVTLFGLFQNQYQLVDTVDFILYTLNQRAEGIGDIVDEGVGDPVGSDGDIVFEVFNTPSDVLRVRRAPEVELPPSVSLRSMTKDLARIEHENEEGATSQIGDQEQGDGRTESVPSRKTIMYMLSGSR